MSIEVTPDAAPHVAAHPSSPVPETIERTRAHGKRGEPRFGLRVPRGGAPVPFRVLVSRRWLATMLVALLGAVGGLWRASWRQRGAVLLAGAGTAFAGIARGVWQARRVEFERITINVPDLPSALDGFRIAQLTDLHLGSPFTVANLQRTVQWLQQHRPDLIVFTGDFISFDDKIPLLRDGLHGITAPHGVYAILGNHDYWTRVPLVEQALREHNIELLRNEARPLPVGDATLWLVGIDCIWEARHDLERAFAAVPPAAPTIALAHEPDIADEIAPYAPILQLSGHTHAGHVTLPLLGPLFLPRHGLRYYEGRQRVGHMWLYVSRGLGGYPLRFGCPPEVTEITLRRT